MDDAFDRLTFALSHAIKNDGLGPDAVFTAIMFCLHDALTNLDLEHRQEYVDTVAVALPEILATVNQLDAVH